jgi:hypothetical protein
MGQDSEKSFAGAKNRTIESGEPAANPLWSARISWRLATIPQDALSVLFTIFSDCDVSGCQHKRCSGKIEDRTCAESLAETPRELGAETA